MKHPLNIAFPLHLNRRGRTESADDERHVEGMLEMLLLTTAGERVNRPDFGGGLRQLLFGPISTELAATLQHTLRAEVLQWLDDVVDLRDLSITTDDNRIAVSVTYSLRQDDSGTVVRTAEFIQNS
jgi:phage baseplate assembly protein W